MRADPNTSRVVVVVFTIEGCDACNSYKPRVQKIAVRYQQIVPIVVLDANDPRNAALATRLNVGPVPATFVLRKPTGIIRVEGEIPDSQVAWLFDIAAREATTPTNY